MGMSEFDTGRMAVYGGLNLGLWGNGAAAMPRGAGSVTFTAGETSASAAIAGGSLRKGDHVYSLLLVDDATGKPLPLYYTKRTAVEAGGDGAVTRVSVAYERGEVRGKVRAYYMVDTYPAARGTVNVSPK